MKVVISNTSQAPLYQQIKDQIKDAILKEEFVEGDALPSIRAFANVSTSNIELLRDSKRRLVEKKMLDMIQTAKSLGISKDDLNAMMEILYEEEN